MANVKYKFIFNSEIDLPESIEFDGIPADIANDNKGGFIIEGEVTGVSLDSDGKLPVFVTSSGRTGRSWQLEVSFNSKKLLSFPILGTIKNNGFYTLNKRYKIQP
jgi:hypothetical protein